MYADGHSMTACHGCDHTGHHPADTSMLRYMHLQLEVDHLMVELYGSHLEWYAVRGISNAVQSLAKRVTGLHKGP